ncbi:hypothetical protein CYMTET_14353 [Cymbomonas tetramitiformis]|uniref:Uncharacterized protein n=1 Tax=Cymbomonas tetramitiformis TaxID=36881 RepID=A0AAE0GGJ2_9CHLO|nr:hypothetical protein CYMTET_14353 [Cymbomonas tetramitiformis]
MSQFSKTWFGTLKSKFENNEDLSNLKFRVFAVCESKTRSLSRTKDKQPVVSVTFRGAPGDVLMATGWKLMAGATLHGIAPLLEHVEVGKLYDIYMSSETFYNLSLASQYELSRNIADISGVVQTLEAIVEVTKDLPHSFIKEWGLPSTWFNNRQVLTIDSDSEDEDYVTPPPPPPKRRKGKGKAKLALPFPDGAGASCAGASEAPTGDVGDPIPEEVPGVLASGGMNSQASAIAPIAGDQQHEEAPIGAGNVVMAETGAGAGAIGAGAVETAREFRIEATEAPTRAVAMDELPGVVKPDESAGGVAVKKPKKGPKAKQN